MRLQNLLNKGLSYSRKQPLSYIGKIYIRDPKVLDSKQRLEGLLETKLKENDK